ncbi:MAG: M20 family metallopeptidase [Actinobacteria bacterium]|nr:MAG: M20 family metallopeptidase [Actinomycetota bacterium]
MDERALAERLITYDTSTLDGIKAAAGFVKGWLESHEIPVRDGTVGGLPVLAATVGPESGPTIVLHGHLDVVPAQSSQFEPRIEGDRLFGRGAYDMKGGLAAMMCAVADLAAQDAVRIHFVCVSDEESDEPFDRGSDYVVAKGYVGDFAITGEPTDLRIGVQSKGVLAVRIEVSGTSAHGSTPWLGDNAVLKAVDVFRQIQAMPFAREASELFDRPSISLGRILGGDRINRVPDFCAIDVDIRYLPGQDADVILDSIRAIPDTAVTVVFRRAPAMVDRENPYVRALAASISDWTPEDRVSIGRDGASDANSFLDAGVPAVEFGPIGGGHHGPDEWVSITSLAHYREALVRFVRTLPGAMGKGHLRIA